MEAVENDLAQHLESLLKKLSQIMSQRLPAGAPQVPSIVPSLQLSQTLTNIRQLSLSIVLLGPDRKSVMQSVFRDFSAWYFKSACSEAFRQELLWLETELEPQRWEGLEDVVAEVGCQIKGVLMEFEDKAPE